MASLKQPVSRRQWLVLAVMVTAAIAASTLLQWWPREGRRLTRTPVVAGVLDDPGSPRSGAPGGVDVTVVVFTDYQCPICKATDMALFRAQAADPTLRVIYKDWPIRGALSDLAARTALAADRQGRYAAVHHGLMEARGSLEAARITAIATEAGTDPVQLAADLRLHAREIDAQLGRHRQQAFGLGLAGTPAYLVGPYLYEGGLDDRRLAHAIGLARRAGPPR